MHIDFSSLSYDKDALAYAIIKKVALYDDSMHALTLVFDWDESTRVRYSLLCACSHSLSLSSFTNQRARMCYVTEVSVSVVCFQRKIVFIVSTDTRERK